MCLHIKNAAVGRCYSERERILSFSIERLIQVHQVSYIPRHELISDPEFVPVLCLTNWCRRTRLIGRQVPIYAQIIVVLNMRHGELIISPSA